MAPNRRIALDETDLVALCAGKVVERDGVAVILNDIGFDRVHVALRQALVMAARRIEEERTPCATCQGTHRVPASDRPDVVGTMPCPECTKRFDESHR